MGTDLWQCTLVVTLPCCPTSTMTWYPTQSYPDIKLTSPGLISIMSSAWLGSEKYQSLSHWFDSPRVRTCVSESPNLPNRLTPLPHLIIHHSIHTAPLICLMNRNILVWSVSSLVEYICSYVSLLFSIVVAVYLTLPFRVTCLQKW